MALKSNQQFKETIHITKTVKNQLFIVSTLLISAFLTFVLGIYIKNNANLQTFLIGLSGNLIVAIIIFLVLERGIKSLSPISEIRNLPASEFIENMRKAKLGERIRILDTFTGIIIEHRAEFEAAVKKAVRNGAKIEILLIHPLSEGAMKRAEQLKGQIDVAEGINKNLARLYHLQAKIEREYDDKKNLEVKLYTALPSIAMYRWGDWAYVSLFPIGARSDRCPNLKVPMENPFGSYADDKFDEIWEGSLEAPTIPLSSHMRLRLDSMTTAHSISSGYYFAYNKSGDAIDTNRCFVAGDSQTFFFSIYESIKEREKIIFSLDGKKWQAEPHLLNHKDPKEVDEFIQGRRLIEQRYEWADGKLGVSPIIIRLKDVTEVTDISVELLEQ